MKKLKIKEKNTHKKKNNTPNFDIAIIFFSAVKYVRIEKLSLINKLVIYLYIIAYAYYIYTYVPWEHEANM